MPPIRTAKPDGAKIRALIKGWAQDRGFKAELSPFARKIGRPRQSVQNIVSYAPDTGTAFIRQIAAELGVKPSDISDMPPEDDDDQEVLAS